ncbi:MAG: phosphatidate cytidylyltransferase [Muribaculaceae bacterium]|nr:phosphatidate cytidylyltransferase [Muribaculaceae bacterium]
MKNLITRALSGIIYVALIVGAIYLGMGWTAALMGIFGALALYEYHKMTILDEGYTSVRLAGFILAEMAGLSIVLAPVSGQFGIVLAGSVIFVCSVMRFVMALYDSKSPGALADLAHWVLSLVYISVPLACAVMLWHNHLLLAVFIMIWLNDTGAYCTGSMFGRRKLFERLSPKKSWEGFFGGMIFCVCAAVLFGVFGFVEDTSILAWAGAGVLACVFSTWGDLFESLIKRTYHTKDAGHLIPGHGGILDRIDSLLFVAPVLLVYFILTEI